MTVNIKLLILVCVLYSLQQASSTRWCDKNQTFHREGLIGERGVFPWLGVLRVHIHKRNKFSVALTGIVLVKEDYAIASAQDVSQVPRKHIIADSRAMFVVSDFTQWFCSVKGVTVQPDFEYNTFNSIALLHLTNSSSNPPICWTTSSGKLVNQLYAMGYTDRNKILEKVLYKMNYVKPDLCEEFYNRVGYKQSLADEQEYVCGAAPTNRDHCRWDSGMALASNTTGHWQLVLCTLSFLATGSYQRIVGLTQHLIQRTTSRCIRQVVEALSHPAIINKWILFPRSQQQRAQIRLEFQRRFRLPGIVGCIDCTHVAIVKPSDDEHLFFNRKGYHSLNVQMVGFGVGGPGCAAPARFISMAHYLPWIESVIEDNEPTYYHGYNIK